MRAWTQDVRSAVRGLAKSRAFTAIAMLMLALGIGANTAVFSLLDEALYQRLPVSHPEGLRTLVVMSQKGEEMSNVPSELFQALRDAPRAFSDVFASMRSEMNFDTGGDAERVLVQCVSGRYYSALGVPMWFGRPIVDTDEDSPDRVVILSHRFWVRRFGGDPSAIGSTIHLNGNVATIIGVTPPDFFGLDRGISPDVSIPLPKPSPFANLWVTARLAPGVSDVAAETEAQVALGRAIEMIRPRLTRYREADRQWYVTLRAGLRPGDTGVGVAMHRYLEPLRILLLLSTGVLLLACVNVANLLLARALARAHEFGVRVALGASRARMFRQVLAESVILATLGSFSGVAFAFAIHRALIRLLMHDLKFQSIAFQLNMHVLLFCLATAAATVLLFGLAPAVRATRVDVSRALQVAAPAGRGRRPALAKALVVIEVAAALALLFGTGLLLRSFQGLRELDPGVALDRMLTMRIGLSARETQRRETAQIYSQIVERVRTIPGVTAAALGWDFALGSGSSAKSIWVEGQAVERSQIAGFNVVGPGFFATAGIPLLLGREFTPADTVETPKVVIVNHAWVREYGGGRNPIGMHLGDEGAASTGKYEIVGVVQDSMTMSLRRAPHAMLYQPLLQDEWASNVVLHVRTAGNPWLVQDRVRAAIRSINQQLPVYDLTTLAERRSLALSQDRMMAALSAALGLMALLLTAVGIYSVIACSVGGRTAEIGIRMALGATAAGVRWLVVRETLVLVVIGGAIGIPLSLTGGRVLKSMLFGIAPQDPLTLAVTLAILISAGLLAGYLPARRAARLDPASALRQ